MNEFQDIFSKNVLYNNEKPDFFNLFNQKSFSVAQIYQI